MSLPDWRFLSSRVEQVRQALPQNQAIFLVGGAVRDALLGRATHDLDFVVEEKAIPTARIVANSLGGAFYALDDERDVGRVILGEANGERLILDFALRRGSTLEDDLRARDFTVDAMAVEIRQLNKLIDPLGGAMDLRHKQLRACSTTTFRDDPLRILRGIRLAVDYRFRMLPETLQSMRASLDGLNRVSADRLRDELARMLESEQPAAAIRALEAIGALPYVLPELVPLKGLVQPAPHVADVWGHTLDTVARLKVLLNILQPDYEPESAANLAMGMVALRLGRFREQIAAHYTMRLNRERNSRVVTMLAALYHDVGKPHTISNLPEGEIHYYGHEQVGAELAVERAQKLHFSNDEITRLGLIVRHHMRPLSLGQGGELPSRRAIYRFFRDAGAAGIDICLLSMADMLATYGPTLPQEVWGHHLKVVRGLMEAWWEAREKSVDPPPLVRGKDLMVELKLAPGPLVGRLLERIREAQAAGQVEDREQAIRLARELLMGEAGDEGV